VWVIKGAIQLRQHLIGFDEIIGADGIRRCGFKLDPELIPTTKAEEMQQTLARLGVL